MGRTLGLGGPLSLDVPLVLVPDVVAVVAPASVPVRACGALVLALRAPAALGIRLAVGGAVLRVRPVALVGGLVCRTGVPGRVVVHAEELLPDLAHVVPAAPAQAPIEPLGRDAPFEGVAELFHHRGDLLPALSLARAHQLGGEALGHDVGGEVP